MDLIIISFDTTDFGENDNWQISISKKLSSINGNILLYTPVETEVEKKYEDNLEVFTFEDKSEIREDIKEHRNYDLILGLSQSTAKLVSKISNREDIDSAVQILDIPWKLLKQNFYLNKDFLFWARWFYHMRSVEGLLLMNPQTEEDFHKNHLDTFINPRYKDMVKWGIDADAADRVPEQEEEDQIVFVSRLVDYKGLDYGIKALSKLENPPKLVVIGDGDKRRDWEKLAEELNVDAEFKGALSDREKYREIKKSKFLIYPSVLENVAGGSLYESLYCKKPAICFSISSLETLIGEYVETVPKKSVNALADKIEYLDKNEEYRRKSGKAGHQYVKNNLTQKTYAQGINEFLEKILDKSDSK